MKPTVRDEGRTMEGARAGCAESACNAVDMVKQTGIPPGIYEGCVLLSTRACRIFFEFCRILSFTVNMEQFKLRLNPSLLPRNARFTLVHSGRS